MKEVTKQGQKLKRRQPHKLTAKQKAFADALLADKKMSATQSALLAYGKPNKPTTYNTAKMIASENLAKPNIMAYLANHAIDAENTLVEVMNEAKQLVAESPGYASVARQSASDILDRVYGKATQRIESTSTSVVIGIDLTSTISS
jgi:hypothetical protein